MTDAIKLAEEVVKAKGYISLNDEQILALAKALLEAHNELRNERAAPIGSIHFDE